MDNILENVKLELDLDLVDASNDKKLIRYINKSCVKIINYLNNKRLSIDKVIKYYPEAVIELTCNIYNSSQSESTGVKSIKEGDVSITYTDDKDVIFTQSIKDSLPLPYVSMY